MRRLETAGTACLLLLLAAGASLPQPVRGGEVVRGTEQSARDFARHLRETLGRELPLETARRLEVFLVAYPGEIHRVKAVENLVTVSMADGSEIPFEDCREKTFEERIGNPDLADTLHDPYPDSLVGERWRENDDPGRYRCDAFLKAVYGADEPAVRANLVAVDFLGQAVAFNRRNGAADALRRVAAELAELLASDGSVEPYLSKLGGTFNWRRVEGTARLSAHSFGISIDLNPDLGGYWRWGPARDRADMERRLAYPADIVAAFERHGFIWGGKWYHFDLMHFEFRPELARQARD